jgi:hypothetical protein
MKRVILVAVVLLIKIAGISQCPNLIEAMVNSCGTNEGNNEFVLFSTTIAAHVSDYTLNYGSTNPPTVNNLAGSDASIKTGTGTITTTGTCAVIEVTSPSTSIPANSRVIFIPTTFDQNYDVTALCNGIDPIYVVYIKMNSSGGLNSNWSAGGTLSNSAITNRYLQIAQSNALGCDANSAPVKSYIALGNWGANTDGNFVTWNDTVPSYGNNGCSTIVLPLKFIDVHAVNKKSINLISWTTMEEMNVSNFVIEKSINAKDYFAIGTINANSNFNNNQQYQFTDNKIENNILYYRIKAVDNNGLISYSNIVAVHSGKVNSTQTYIYPNPAKDWLIIKSFCDKIATSTVSVFDSKGNLVKKEMYQNSGYFDQHQLSISDLSAGTYLLKLNIGGENVMTEKFIK